MPVLSINGTPRDLNVEPQMPVLWALRDELGLTGTKFGCGIGACGACTIEVDGVAMRSCVLPVEAAAGKQIKTIEAEPDKYVKAIQQAWIAQQVPQCGYCQSGMVLACAALLRANPQPTDHDINAAITNLCRCGTYPRIRAGIHQAAQALAAPATPVSPAAPAAPAAPSKATGA